MFLFCFLENKEVEKEKEEKIGRFQKMKLEMREEER